MFADFTDVPFAAEWWTVLAFVWVFIWKGLALWKSARLGSRYWFVALLIVNTLGILEILYIYVFSESKPAPAVAMSSEEIKKEEKEETHKHEEHAS